MFEYFLDSNDAGGGTFYLDAAGVYSVPTRDFYLDSSDAGGGVSYLDSALAPLQGGAVFYYLSLMQIQ